MQPWKANICSFIQRREWYHFGAQQRTGLNLNFDIPYKRKCFKSHCSDEQHCKIQNDNKWVLKHEKQEASTISNPVSPSVLEKTTFAKVSIGLQEICFMMELSLPKSSDLINFVMWSASNFPSAWQEISAGGLAGNLCLSPAVHPVIPAAAVTAGSC